MAEAPTCPIHEWNVNQGQLHISEAQMRGLPHSQAGAGRHKCAYCAQVQGWKIGYAQGLKEGAQDDGEDS